VELLVGDVFANAARATPDRLALAVGDDRLTFGELDRGADEIAGALSDAGIGAGDRVVVVAGTASVELAPLFAAAARIGAVFAPVNGRQSVLESRPIVEAARASLLVADAGFEETTAALADACGVPWMQADWRHPAPGGHSIAQRISAPSATASPRPAGFGERSPHVMFFTSGSTGRPKAAVLSHRTSVLRSHPGSQLEPRGALVCPFPMFHMAAWTLAMQQWHARDALVLCPPDGASIATAIETHRAARVYLIPAIWRRLLDHLASGATVDLGAVAFADTGTSATPPELLAEIAARCPAAVIRVFYGSTEAGNVASLDYRTDPDRPGSCGTPSPLTEVRVVAGGEVQVRSAVLFDGYFEDEAATARAFEDGWFRTGDRAEVDGDGFLTIVGRLSEVIRTGGEGVDPSEVEAVLREHPQVDDVAVVGVPDPQWGEIVCAAIVTRDGAATPTLEEVRAHCEGRLARHKQPRQVLGVDVIPRTAATLQVQRRLLVELAQSG
jgi:acyl-CoA synthetase (AMP-forming)/AMP-acid ligase II